MKVPDDINACIRRLDDTQTEIFDKLEDIIEKSNPKKITEMSIDAIRSQISKEVTKLILSFEQLVVILNTQVNNYRYMDMDKLRVLPDIYGDKTRQLKNALRDTQLKSYTLEEEFIHNQRINKFGIVPEREKTIAEMRNELFGGRLEEAEKELEEKNVEEQIMQQNKSITTSLQSTRQLMTSSILQTELNIDSLEQQTKDLSSFDSLLTDLASTLKKSRNIVKFIEKQDRQDKNRIYMSVGFLLICCAWVIWRRILRVPVRLLLWSMLKTFRIFLWLMPKSTLTEILEDMAATTTGIVAATTTGIMATQSTLSQGKPQETLIKVPQHDQENEDSVKTWDEIINQSTELVKDEL